MSRCGSTSCSKHSLAQQPAVDDARRADLDDLVARRRARARWSRCRTRCRPVRPAAGRRARGSFRGLEQVEVVVLGPAVAVHEGTSIQRLLRAGQRQQETEEGWWRTRSRSNQNSPSWRSTTSRTVSGLDSGRASSARPPSSSPSRCSSTGRSTSGRDARADPLGQAQLHQLMSYSSRSRDARQASACSSEKLSTCSHSVASTSPARARCPGSASMRRSAADTRSAPSMSSSGQRVLRSCVLRAARSWMRRLIARASSRMTAWKRSRMAVSMSASSSISTAACRLPSEARLPSVKPCSSWSRAESSSNWRVMLSSISTKPCIAASSVAVPRTGVITARSSCPAGVVVTNCAVGRASRVPGALRSSPAHGPPACARTRRRSSGPGRSARRHRPARARPTARGTVRAPLVVEQDAPVEVAHHDALRQLGHQRRQAAALLVDVAAGLATCCAMSSRSCARCCTSWLRLRARPAARAADGRDLVRHFAVDPHLGLLQQARRSGHVRWYSSLAPQAHSAHRPRPTSISTMPLWLSAASSTWRCGSSSVAQNAAPPPSANSSQQQPRRQQRGQQAFVDVLQGAASSICATLATSSLVENGLVM